MGIDLRASVKVLHSAIVGLILIRVIKILQELILLTWQEIQTHKTHTWEGLSGLGWQKWEYIPPRVSTTIPWGRGPEWSKRRRWDEYFLHSSYWLWMQRQLLWPTAHTARNSYWDGAQYPQQWATIRPFSINCCVSVFYHSGQKLAKLEAEGKQCEKSWLSLVAGVKLKG